MLFYEIQLRKVTVKIFLSHLIEKKNTISIVLVRCLLISSRTLLI